MTPRESADEHLRNAHMMVDDALKALAEAAGSKEGWVREAVDRAHGAVVGIGIRVAGAREALAGQQWYPRRRGEGVESVGDQGPHQVPEGEDPNPDG